MSKMAVIVVFIIFLLFFCVYQKYTNPVCTSRKQLVGKTALITGGTSGMGLVIAKDFARRGARVIVACPFEDEGASGLQAIIERTGNKNVEFKLLDLSSFESTRKFAADILKNEHRLDILINNAGVGGPIDATSSDGLNFIMHVNYFGAFLLTLLLLPLLKKSGTPEEPSRIINTSSVLHRFGRVSAEPANRFLMKRISAYSDSKICLIAFSREFKNRASGLNVVMNNVDPGAVGTNIFITASRYFGALLKLLFYISSKTSFEGAQTALYVALDQKAGEVSGEFFKNCQMGRAIKPAYDEKMANKLWKESIRIVKLSDEELDLCFRS